jgi:hypothetical protein
VAVAGGEAQGRPARVAGDAGRDARQRAAQRLGVAAQRGFLGRGAGGAGQRREVARHRREVERADDGGQPDAVGVDVCAGRAPQRLAELGVLEAFFDLGALAVEVLDVGGGLVGDVGEDEAVAVDRRELAGERELRLLGVDRLGRRARGPRESSGAEKRRRRTINRSGSWRHPSGASVASATSAPSMPVAGCRASSRICSSALHIAVVRGTDTVKRAVVARNARGSSIAW